MSNLCWKSVVARLWQEILPTLSEKFVCFGANVTDCHQIYPGMVIIDGSVRFADATIGGGVVGTVGALGGDGAQSDDGGFVDVVHGNQAFSHVFSNIAILCGYGKIEKRKSY